MGNVVVMVVIVMLAGWIVWRRRHRWQTSTAAVPPQGMSRGENLALKAFVRGNTYLMEGKFAEAIAAFHQAREFEPTHPHVAGRLAEVERRQQEASAMALASATC